jgi:sulfofructose kinase
MDILGIGVLAVDDIIHVARYPAADEKQPVVREERVLGGLAGTALAAAARLGARCAYLGSLGTDDLSRAALEGLSEIGVDVGGVSTQQDAGPVHSIIVADDTTHTRNIFFNVRKVAPPPMESISTESIARAKVLFVDHVHLAVSTAACRIARTLGVPSVADVESGSLDELEEFLSVVDHLIVSRSFASVATGATEPAEMVRLLGQAHKRDCTAVTCGRQGCFYSCGDGDVMFQPAPQVAAVDTTGCGDVFHGAYAWAISQGHGVARCILLASAAAAAFAAKPAGWEHLPQLPEVLALASSLS